MDIQQYIALDKELLLNLNGSNSLFLGRLHVGSNKYVYMDSPLLLYCCISLLKIIRYKKLY